MSTVNVTVALWLAPSESVADAVMKAKPATAKGGYLEKVSISSTMGPGIKIDTADLQAALR